jgi:hypothetical protein
MRAIAAGLFLAQNNKSRADGEPTKKRDKDHTKLTKPLRLRLVHYTCALVVDAHERSLQ